MNKSKWLLPLLLLGSAPTALALLIVTKVVEPQVAGVTIRGLAWTSGGGFLTGIAVKRFLVRPKRDAELIFGLLLATTLGTLTIGGLYLVLLSNPMEPIGTPERTVEQVMGFVQFLLAQAAGIVVTPAPLPPQDQNHHPRQA